MNDAVDQPLVPPDIINLSRRLAAALAERGWSCATAESCTGGGVALAITSVAGSSDYMLGGVVAYSNAVKRDQLGVAQTTLDQVGAVSEECAGQMARGVRGLVGADLGVATTGIAGPGGATTRKPVGLVYLAVSTPEREAVRELRLSGDRLRIMRASTRMAIELAIEMTGAPAPGSER